MTVMVALSCRLANNLKSNAFEIIESVFFIYKIVFRLPEILQLPKLKTILDNMKTHKCTSILKLGDLIQNRL